MSVCSALPEPSWPLRTSHASLVFAHGERPGGSPNGIEVPGTVYLALFTEVPAVLPFDGIEQLHGRKGGYAGYRVGWIVMNRLYVDDADAEWLCTLCTTTSPGATCWGSQSTWKWSPTSCISVSDPNGASLSLERAAVLFHVPHAPYLEAVPAWETPHTFFLCNRHVINAAQQTASSLRR